MKQDNKALIEKAFEKWKNDSGCRNNSCNDCQGGCNGAFIAGATWQREQLEAEIKELKDNQLCQCGDYHDKESLCSVCVMVKVSEAESKIQPAVDKAREQLIQKLREAKELLGEHLDYDRKPELIQRTTHFLAKLDLLEGEK